MQACHKCGSTTLECLGLPFDCRAHPNRGWSEHDPRRGILLPFIDVGAAIRLYMLAALVSGKTVRGASFQVYCACAILALENI